MFSRFSVLFSLILIASFAPAKDKSKSSLPAIILRAETVAVIVNPGSEVPLANPGENRDAQSDVEQALTKWGRLRVVMDPSTADLVISVRRGRGLSPTIAGGDPNQRPIVLQPGEGSTRVGIQTGKPPRTGTGYPETLPRGRVWKPDRPRMFSRSIADKMPTRSMARPSGVTWARTHFAHPPFPLSNSSAKQLKKRKSSKRNSSRRVSRPSQRSAKIPVQEICAQPFYRQSDTVAVGNKQSSTGL